MNIYKLLVLYAVFCVGPAFADTPPCTNCGVTTDTRSEAVANNTGNAQTLIFNSPSESVTRIETHGTTTLKNVPSIGAPALITSNDTCMGTTSGGLAVAGFGLSIGSTWSDDNCIMLKNSREFWNMGMKAASMARMCMDTKNKEALELTGFKCPVRSTPERQQRTVNVWGD
jgi:hypothetical protein